MITTQVSWSLLPLSGSKPCSNRSLGTIELVDLLVPSVRPRQSDHTIPSVRMVPVLFRLLPRFCHKAQYPFQPSICTFEHYRTLGANHSHKTLSVTKNRPPNIILDFRTLFFSDHSDVRRFPPLAIARGIFLEVGSGSRQALGP